MSDLPTRDPTPSPIADPDATVSAPAANGPARVSAPADWPPGYEMLRELGRGGMGVVYHARDSRLGREVALKRIHEEVASDPERLARFEREARLLASLNHPNIATLYGVEGGAQARFLVMELVPGRTIAERLAGGRLPLREAVDIGRQVADALEAAHARGVIHRDLKPANVKVTPEGRVKVLDFGLAKSVAVETDAGGPTTSIEQTREGMIVGTPGYMSPEQVRGQPLDKRTDIWSFGCLLYEALTGRGAFAGPTLSDTLAAVLEREPDWSALPPSTPASIRNLLQRCLRKDLSGRLRDIGDARLELDDSATAVIHVVEPAAAMPPPRPGRRRVILIATHLLCVLAGAAAAVALGDRPSHSSPNSGLLSQNGTIQVAPGQSGTVNFPIHYGEPPNVELEGHFKDEALVTNITEKGFQWKSVGQLPFAREFRWVARGMPAGNKPR